MKNKGGDENNEQGRNKNSDEGKDDRDSEGLNTSQATRPPQRLGPVGTGSTGRTHMGGRVFLPRAAATPGHLPTHIF